MKKTLRWLLVVGVLAGMSTGYWWWLRSSRTKATPTQNGGDLQAGTTNVSSKQAAMSNVVPTLPMEKSLNPAIHAFILKRRAEENAEVTFFGKVVDQSGTGISGTRIELEYERYLTTKFEGNAAVENVREQKNLEVVSDQAGDFSLRGFEAGSVTFKTFRKDGYTLVDKYMSRVLFSPRLNDAHQANPQAPVVFEMWRQGRTESLIHADKRIAISGSEIPKWVNLLTGELSDKPESNSDLKIMLRGKWTGTEPVPFREWELTLEPVSGGIQETTNSFLFLGPVDGYTSRIVYDSQSPEVKKWHRSGQPRKFFLKSRGGKIVSALTMELMIHAQDGARLHYMLRANPAGSRNLEPDPEKQITDPEEIRRLDEATRP